MAVAEIFLDDDFVDDHNRVIEYDGSEVTWRLSVQAIIEKEGKLFLVKDRRQSFYSTPGGAMESTESFHETLQREVLEEAGAAIMIGPLLDVIPGNFYHSREKRFYRTAMFFFSGELVGEPGVPTDDYVEYARFFDLKTELHKENLNQRVYLFLRRHGYLPEGT